MKTPGISVSVSRTNTEKNSYFFFQELLDTLSKRLKEKSLLYSQDEFKDIVDIVKVGAQV